MARCCKLNVSGAWGQLHSWLAGRLAAPGGVVVGKAPVEIGAGVFKPSGKQASHQALADHGCKFVCAGVE
jgi:hypothetical protein